MVAKGERYQAMGCLVTVNAVSQDGVWANVQVRQLETGASWGKRQPLPFPESWVKVSSEAAGQNGA